MKKARSFPSMILLPSSYPLRPRFAIIFGIKLTSLASTRMEKRLNQKAIIYGTSMPKRSLKEVGYSVHSTADSQEHRMAWLMSDFAGVGHPAYGIRKPRDRMHL